MKNKKILVISHNVFSVTENMGKTLVSYFKDFAQQDLAQFYIHSEVPTSPVCSNYYRVTDKEMIRSVFGRKTGKIFTEKDVETGRATSRTDSGTTARLYQKARKRTPIIYILRNLWWKLGHWNNQKLQGWLNNFNPDCVFFASGDYTFLYQIALKIAKSRNIPLYVCCVDDFYFNNKNSGAFLGKWQHKRFMKSVQKTVQYATKLFCICNKMSQDYGRYFQKQCVTLPTAATFNSPISTGQNLQISYLGNLGYNRHLQLAEIGRALKSLNLGIRCIDVYSSESRPEILKHLTMQNGVRFHGAVSANQVQKIMAQSLAVIHTESFDPVIQRSVQYSVSTKIADSLMSGTCLFAYGPKSIASMEYLSQNGAAVCAFSKAQLPQVLTGLLTNAVLRNSTVQNALTLAQKNHRQQLAGQIIQKELTGR